MNNNILKELFEVIKDRKINKIDGSYTNYLLESGIDKILKKVGEETAEIIIAAKNNSTEQVVMETCDLVYHLLVMLSSLDMDIDSVFAELSERTKKQKNLKQMKTVNKNT